MSEVEKMIVSKFDFSKNNCVIIFLTDTIIGFSKDFIFCHAFLLWLLCN